MRYNNKLFHSKCFNVVSILIMTVLLSNCVTIAPPSPLVTLGGPKTTHKGTSEAALAVGIGVALFDNAHTGAQGWFARYKYGIKENIDLGMDFYGAARNDGQSMGLKLASRYQLNSISRFELGIGAADDSDGKSLVADVGYTIGSIRSSSWNYYSTLRFAYAHGFAGNSLTLPGQTKGPDSIAPPNTIFSLISLGAQGKIQENQNIIFESGYGYIFPKGEKSGPAFYLTIGLMFNIP